MHVSWRFIVGLALGCAAGIAFFVGSIYSQLGVPTHSSQWIYDVTQKQIRLANQVAGPRLLIVSGSSGLFGLNAAEIQRVTGRPTINLSTHAALLLEYRLDRLKQIVRPGDTLLFAWEYEHYLGSGAYSPEITYDYIIARDPDYFRKMPLVDKIAMATRLPFRRLQKGWANQRRPEKVRAPNPPYSPYTPITPGIDCLDENGDEIFNTPDQQRASGDFSGTPVLATGLPSTDTDGFRELAGFIAWAHAQPITILATFPCIQWEPAYDSAPGAEAVRQITEFYRAHGVPMVGTAQEATLHSSADFLDSSYHLTHDAAIQRTDRLIPELRPYLSPAR